MNIDDILTEIEYTKERSAKELFAFVEQKEKELRVWSGEHSGTEELRKIKRDKLSSNKELYRKFLYELTPFAYYANTYYANNPEVRFKPCCGSEPYDEIIVDNNKEIFVEITDDIDGCEWALQKELLIKNGWSPGRGEILGVKGNKTTRKRATDDIITSEGLVNLTDEMCKTKELVKERASKKCKKSMEPQLPYGQDKTILIVTFDDDDFVNFKQAEIDSMEHNFIKIILFGWTSKKFIIENP